MNERARRVLRAPAPLPTGSSGRVMPQEREGEVLLASVVMALRRWKGRRGRAFYAVVEGGIASGKTSLLERLAQAMRPRAGQDGLSLIEIFPEPVDQWEDCVGRNLLRDFYESRCRGSPALRSLCLMRLQMNIVLSLVEREKNIQEKLVDENLLLVVAERSLSSTWAFIEENTIVADAVDSELLSRLLTRLDDMSSGGGPTIRPDASFYLQTRPEEAMARVRRRARDGEVDNLQPDYMLRIDRRLLAGLVERNETDSVVVLDNSNEAIDRTAERVIDTLLRMSSS